MLVEVTRTRKRIVKLKYENGVLKVLAYYFVSKNKIKEIIANNIDWINNQKDKNVRSSEFFDTQSNPVYENQELQSSVISDIWASRKTLILGDVIDVLPHCSSKTLLEGNTLFICDKSYQNKEQRRKLVVNYLKRVAQIYVSAEVAEFGTTNSICPAKIEFKDVAQGWVKQTLLSEKILCIDYRVAQLPQNLRTYVIAEAFARLICNNDGEKFVKSIQRFIPEYDLLRNELRNYDFLKDI